MEESIAKLKEIQLGFEQNLNKLHQKIVMFDSVPKLQNIFEDLKKDAEIKAIGLEAEVKNLREELKYIRELLGINLENSNSGNS